MMSPCDIVGIVDASGNIVVEYKYDAWGKIIARTGSLASTLGYLNPFRHRGYVYDEETALYYLRSRYYNPERGRFINADVLLGKAGDMLTHNVFAYCMNNPIVCKDPSGFSAINSVVEKISDAFDSFMVRAKKWWHTPQIVNDQLLWQRQLYPLYDPGDAKNAGVKIGPLPVKIASGKNYKNVFSVGDCLINYSTFMLDDYLFLAPAANAVRGIQVNINIYQIGALPPEAKVTVKFYRQYTDTSLGYPMQKVVESEWVTISGKEGYRYEMWGNGECSLVFDYDNYMMDVINGTRLE